MDNKKFADLLSMGGRIFYETHHRPLEKLQGFINEINYTLISKDKKRLPVLVNTRQEKNAKGEVLFTQFFIVDISERKQYEQELLIAKQKAEAAAEAKDRFISTISHEIRTPLHGIMGTTDLLLRNDKNINKEELLKILQFSTQSLLELINDVLDYTKGEANELKLHNQPFNLRDTVENLIGSLRSKAVKKGLMIHLTIDKVIPPIVIADAVKISQVLNNLVGNAIKFTNAGSIQVTLRAQKVSQQSISIYFEIKDNGVGIPPEKQKAIFAPFTQLNDVSLRHVEDTGTGLGLTISQRLIHLFGGQLLLESEVGKGSTFHFTIALKIASEEAIRSIQSEARKTYFSPLDGIKVLIAEDNKTNIYLASLYFKKWQLDFDVAKNGKIALEMVQKNEYDLVLMDLRMPIMDGFEASAAIRNLPDKKFAQLPIIALTASTFSTIQEKAIKAGITGLINKPFEPTDLYRKIQKYQKKKFDTIPLFQIEALYDYFEKDAKAVKEFIAVILEDFTAIKTALFTAIQAGDITSYRNEQHKTHTTLTLLTATRLESLLIQGRERMEAADFSSDDVVFIDLKATLESFIKGLQRVNYLY